MKSCLNKISSNAGEGNEIDKIQTNSNLFILYRKNPIN